VFLSRNSCESGSSVAFSCRRSIPSYYISFAGVGALLTHMAKGKKRARRATPTDSIGDAAVQNVIDSVAGVDNRNDHNHNDEANTCSCSAYRDTVSSLRAQVESLQSTISTLSAHVSFLLSFVGAVDAAPTPSQATTQLPSTFAVTAGSSVSGNKDQYSFADVARRSGASGGGIRAPNIREAAVTAFYVDKAEAERRESSFIVSGLLSSHSSSDGELVSALCQEELGLSLDIAFTKRLGKVIPDKVQPLLVHVKQVDQAKSVISSARQLRSSAQPNIRDHVYINANLTKAASRAAYELRCRRRQAASRKSTPVLNPTAIPFSPQQVDVGQ